MKKIFNFVVNRYQIIIVFFLIISGISGFLTTQVNVNNDMTKYLSNESSMKIGIDKMEEEFGETETAYTIRLMFSDLTIDEKKSIKKELENFHYVSSVDYDIDSEDYNIDNYTKYVINTDYGYGTPEAVSIENNITTNFAKYNMTYKNDDEPYDGLPASLLALAVALFTLILLVMSGSWTEPVLFLIAIGIAVLINMGTNFFLGSVSSVTHSIAAILQMVLSMDYSIILMNRYRQELAKTSSHKEAMSQALVNAFTSISSSSLTTIVGLLALCFMRFKIGMDLGVVLAKGVFISVLTVLLLLPGLILWCTPLILKTSKKVPNIPTNGIARIAYNLRHIMVAAFVLVFAVAYIFQQKTEISYTADTPNEISEIFSDSESLVLLYNTADDSKATILAEELNDSDTVKNATNYSSSLGKQYDVNDLVDILDDLMPESDDESTSSIKLDSTLLQVLFYDYYTSGKTENITVSNFLNFLVDDILTNDTFTDQLDEDITENVDTLKKFANANELTKNMTSLELANFFDMNAEDIDQLFLYYYIQKGGVNSGSMTIPVFVNFVLNDLANDETYGDMFDADMLSQIRTLSKFTNAAEMVKEKTYTEVADLMDMDSDTMRLLFIYYYTYSAYAPSEMTLPELVSFIEGDIMTNPTFSSAFDSQTKAQFSMLSQFTNTQAFTTPLSAAQLATAFGMDEAIIRQIFMLDTSNLAGKTMSLMDFMGFVVNNLLDNPAYSSYFDDATKSQLSGTYQLLSLAVSGTGLTYHQMAATLGLDETMAANLYGLYFQTADVSTSIMTLGDFTNFLVNVVLTNPAYAPMFDTATATQLTTMNQMIGIASSGMQFGPAQLSASLGMSEELITQVFAMYFADPNKTMSLQNFVDFLINNVASNPTYSAMLGDKLSQISMLKVIMDSTLAGTTYDFIRAGRLFDMDASAMKLLFTYKDAGRANWTISMKSLIDFMSTNIDTFSSMIDEDALEQIDLLQKIIEGSVNNTSYTSVSLADMLDIESKDLNQLFLLYISKHGDTSNWKISVQTFVDFIISDVLTDPDMADELDADVTDDLTMAQDIVNAVIDGREYSSEELYDLIGGFSDDLDMNMVDLMYLFYASDKYSDKTWTLSIKEFADYMATDLINDQRFDTVLEDSFKTDIIDMQDQLEEAVEMLMGSQYSRLIITLPEMIDMDEITAFYDDLTAKCKNTFTNDYYLIGNSAMSYEMSKTFSNELTLITLLTAISIFIVVALSYLNLALPAILVVLVQGSVFVTVSIIGLQGYSINYLALLIVQSMLMGSTIDYGILFSTYYREARATMEKKEALAYSYHGAIHTIITSGGGMIIITALLSTAFEDPSTAQICQTLSIGTLCASLMILLMLPGLLLLFDKFVVKNRFGKVKGE